MRLNAFREWRGGCQLVGSIALDGSEVSFAYDAAYLDDADAAAVSLSLPLREEPFAEAEASPFFAGLAPEGDMRRLVGDFIRSTSFAKMLERLNNESIGALVFAPDGEEPDLPGSYEPIGTGELTRFRDSPSEVSFEMGMASRLSLAGAQSKVGLYHVGDDPLEGWYVPQGAAPTTHIVKAPTRVFPNQTVNEALCLESARLCGFDAAGWELIDLPGGEPLLAVRRFDRMLPDGAWGTGELPRPQRLHQEDLCQATALMPEMKYEPTGGNFLSRCAGAVARCCANPFGDRAFLLQSVFLDYLLGNCDNHLKNRSLLWDASWRAVQLSPLYDLTCTTIYPGIAREMGVSLAPSRRVDDVREKDLSRAARDAGVPERLGVQLYREVCEELPAALDEAERVVAEMGFETVREVAAHVRGELADKTRL